MNNIDIPVALRKQNKVVGEFYPLQKAELMALRKAKLINNAAYVHFALRLENPFCDRPVEIIVKEFALRWRLPEKSVYSAVAKLKEIGLLKIKSGKLVVEWSITPDAEQLSIPIEQPKAVNEFNSEVIADPWLEDVAKFSDPRKILRSEKNSQIREKILRSEKKFSDLRKNSQIGENRGLKAVSDIASAIPQTIQIDQTNQTAEEQNKNTNEELANNETVKSEESALATGQNQNLIEKEEIPRDVTHKKTKIISPSKNSSTSIPEDLKEKLRELEIPLDKRVLDAIASHDISQAYGAAAHVENTWETVGNAKSIFLFQLPQQPIEKLGSRVPEIGKQLREQYAAIEEERKDPEYQKKSKEYFAKIREKLGKKREILTDDPWT